MEVVAKPSHRVRVPAQQSCPFCGARAVLRTIRRRIGLYPRVIAEEEKRLYECPACAQQFWTLTRKLAPSLKVRSKRMRRR
ncbi:hypothetical protein [Thermosulfurimonas sp. F29]|uniref:hypothetical protein n=1 Tax=Thermosulfurimonas sp. F29 TaxID=2867247 RepID=UPI001C82C859|nr:hypothetical protein [Thermosulfurimonas sp. F29]MBX6424182.1 hypothetical protein [Thermosulfurimonas sp. F29]